MVDIGDKGLLSRTKIRVEWVGGATASGIANPNSATQARPKFDRALRKTARGQWVLTCLGEVDAGFLVFMAGDPTERCEAALQKYFEFLQDAVLSRQRRLLVVTVVPPMIEDYATWPGLAGKRRNVDASWQQRSDMTQKFNAGLLAWCAHQGVPVLDLYSLVVDAETGRVLLKYANDDPDDHHLRRAGHADLLVKLLQEQGFR